MAIINSVSKSQWTRRTGSITNSTTLTVYSSPTTQQHGISYVLNAHNDANNASRTQVGIINRAGSSVTDSIYAKLGASLNISIDVSISGGNLIIEATNNEAYDVNYDLLFTRLG